MVTDPFKTRGFVVFCGAPCDEFNIAQAIAYCKNQGFTHETAKIVKLDDCVIVKIK